MAGTTVQSELTAARGELSFAPATEQDDGEIRAMLRDNPMGGDIRISLEREPSYFRSISVGCDVHQTIVVRHRSTGQMICVGSIAESIRYINGSPRRVGYLGGLRLANSESGNFAAIRGGFRLFRQLHEDGGPELYLTSITSDNHRARRFLEANLPGMPVYCPLGQFVTLILPVRRRGEFFHPGSAARAILSRKGLTLRRARCDDADALCTFLAAHGRTYQFSPCWTREDLFGDSTCVLPQPSDFRLVFERGRIVGCVALWDQRPFKQVIIRGYGDRLARWRPVLNVFGHFSPPLRLPSIGQVVRQAYVSHFAIDPRYPEIMLPLLLSLHGPAYQRRLDYLILGLSERDPRLPVLRREYRCRTYSNQLYVVHWPDCDFDLTRIDDRIPCPEVATL